MDISNIDKNFAAEKVSWEKATVYRLPCEPFEICGLLSAEPGEIKRLPDEVALQCNEPLRQMYVCPSGGRIRFCTDSEKIIIKCAEPDMLPSPHMAFTGSHCFDLYADREYIGVFRPDTSGSGKHVSRKDFYTSQGYDSLLRLHGHKMREILIHFPLYSRVDEVLIALDEGSAVSPPAPYKAEKPFVFYGTSVTQGGCVSHPGNNYPAILSRWLDSDFINLGFSDGGRGEQDMAKYIATLDMSALVLNYDGNVRNPERLSEVYEPFYRTVRDARPGLPIVFATNMFDYYGDDFTARGRDLIKEIYLRVSAEDKNVYFIDGLAAIAPYGGTDTCSVEHCHANDLGSWVYAKALEPLLRKIIFNGGL
ncbi:MAG: hypothetical protein IKR26_00300 [Lachnospiraceae bacterium]|nr:hypothetical protein [Lachnospiraceae bacterium]